MSINLRGPVFAAIVSAGLGAAAVPAHAETLADALALAYESNPTLQAQRATQRALDENYVQARSGWRPTLSVQAVATYTETRTPRVALPFGRTIDENNGGSAQLNFTQPIWTGGRVAAAVNAATADILAGRENLRRIENQVMAAVIQAYADVRRDTEALRIQQENAATLQRQLDESNARFNVGEITRTDVALSQARLSASQSQLQTAKAQLAITRAVYAALVGQNPGELAPEPELTYLLPATVDEAFDLAERFNPTLRSQQYSEQASRARVAGARAERNPNVSVSAEYGYAGGTVDPFERERYARELVGRAVVTVPLFNGGLTTSRIRQSIERNNADRITVETQRRAVLQSLTQAWNQLLAARSNIGSTAEQVRAARIAIEGTRQEQQVGLRTTIDVLNAEQERRAAELAQVNARRDEYVATASVLVAMGRLEGRNLTPSIPQYNARTHFKRLRVTWGWVPWEEPISIIDNLLSTAPGMQVREKAMEPSIGPGLQPAPVPVVPKGDAASPSS